MLEKLSSVLFGPTSGNSTDGNVMVWRTPREEFDPKCTVPTVKHGGGSVMIWGCFTRRRLGKLCVLHRIMDRFYYRDILEQNLLLPIDHFKLGQQSHFMHDNDRKHTSGLAKDWLKQKTIQTLPWPSFSSDLNPIEKLNEESKNTNRKMFKN